MIGSYLKKEWKLFVRQKSFLRLILLFAMVYGVVGYGIYQVGFTLQEVKQDITFYFMYIYPLALVPMMLQLYPITKDISEMSSGGIENLLCTGCKLADLIVAKAICLWGALMIPPAVLILCLMILNHQWVFGILSLFGTTAFTMWGISCIYVSQGMKRKYRGNLMKAGYVSFFSILILTYFPMVSEKLTGKVMDIRISLLLAIGLAVVTLVWGSSMRRKVQIEEIL